MLDSDMEPVAIVIHTQAALSFSPATSLKIQLLDVSTIKCDLYSECGAWSCNVALISLQFIFAKAKGTGELQKLVDK